MSNVIYNALRKIRSLGILSSVGKDSSDHIGISFGNYSSSVAIMEGNNARIIKKIPTIKLFEEKDCPGNYNCISFGVKQLLGRKFEDPLVAKEMKRDSFMKKIVSGDDGDAWYVSTAGLLHSPCVILAMVLKELRVDAELELGREVSRAVIAVPSWFEDAQIVATMKSCYTAGISELQVISEATATAISFGMCKKREGHVFAVVDMGERTLDVSILQVVSNGSFVSKGPVHSDMLLGGVEFDNVLLDFTVQQLKILEGVDVVGDQAVADIRFAADTHKKQLSSEAAISIPLNVPLVLTRSEFDRLVNHLIQRIRSLCTNCLKDACITPKDVDEVLLVGGMARVPVVQKAITEIFEKCPSTGVEPDEAVALGAAAAIQAGVVGDRDFAFLEGA